MKKTKLLIFPILALLWMVGWICYVAGERKEPKP
jgi:hypothetical protein